jgi:hypothetical protein
MVNDVVAIAFLPKRTRINLPQVVPDHSRIEAFGFLSGSPGAASSPRKALFVPRIFRDRY